MIDALPHGITRIDTLLPPNNLVRRWHFLQSKIPGIIKRGNYHLLFTVAETASLKAPCPKVTLVRNPNFFADVSTYRDLRWKTRLLLYRLTRFPFAYWTLKTSDILVFVSQAFRDEIVTKYDVSISKTRIVHHGIHRIFESTQNTSSNESTQPPYILSVSTLLPHKNYETLIDAYANIVQRRDGCMPPLVIAGEIIDKPYHAMLMRRIVKNGISEKVTFLGKVNHSRLAALYRDACALVLPSYLETFGHPLVEAMASGVPVIASDLPACREICGDAAVFFDPHNKEELANVLFSVILNKEAAQRMREAGKMRSQAFSWAHTARKMAAIFKEALQ